MINNPDFLQSIDTLVIVKKGELFFMILKYCVSNKLSNFATTNLFKLFNVVFESPVMPDSRYAVDKLLNPETGAEFHAVCHDCSTYIGKHGEIESITHCQICQAELDLKNPSSTSFFVIMDPSAQIKDLISFYEDHYDYMVSQTVSKLDYIEDVLT